MSGEVMPKDQLDFIKKLEVEMLERTNMSARDANDFAFRVWQHKEFLLSYLTEDKLK